jgi:hypothetical protein
MFRPVHYFILLLLVPLISFGQKDSSLPDLTNKMPLLNARLYIQCPAGSINVPRPHDVLSLPPNGDQETRITYETEMGKLVIFAQEMNAFSTPHLLEEVTKLYTSEERPDYQFKWTTTADHNPAVLTTPLKRDSTMEAILINSMLVQTRDSTLVQVAAFINPKAYPNINAFLSLSEAILKSITEGPRQISFKARKETVAVLGGICSLTFDCPYGFIILPEKGFDYNTYQVRKLEPLGNHAPGGIILYTGLQPHLLAPSYHFLEGSEKLQTDLFLEKEITWKTYSDASRSIFLQEAIYDADDCGEGLKIHIALIASSEKEMQMLVPIAHQILFSK